jgi:hypothetical protein
MKKKGLFTLLLLIVTALPALAAPGNASGPWGIDIGTFSSLSSAKRSPVTANKAMVITKAMNCNNLTIPRDRPIVVKPGGRIRYSGNLVINSHFDAGLYQALEKVGSGTVTFRMPKVHSEWWGAVGDNVADDNVALQTAATAAAGGRLMIYQKHQSSANIILPANTIVEGLERKSTGVTFTHTGDGFQSTWPASIGEDRHSYAANIKLRDLYIKNTNGANTGAAFADVGGSYITVEHCYMSGFKYGVLLDQSEIVRIRDSYIEGQSLANIWVVNGSDHTAGALPMFTNQIVIDGNQLNQTNSSSTYNIIDDGGANHTISNNNFQSGIYGIRAAGVHNLNITGANEMEGHTLGDITFYNTSLAGTTVGNSKNVAIRDGDIISPAGANIYVDFVDGLIIENCKFGQVLSDNAAINFKNSGSNVASGVVLKGNQKLVDGQYRFGGPFLTGFSGPTGRVDVSKQGAVTYVVSAVSTGAQTVTPKSMEFIYMGSTLSIANEDGTNQEFIVVTSTTSTTFTATFVSTKAANWIIEGQPSKPAGYWTPALYGATTAGTQTYATTPKGFWTRHDDMVFVEGTFTMTALDGATAGAIRISGLPYTATNTGIGSAGLNVTIYQGITLSGSRTDLKLYVPPGQNYIELWKSGSGVGAASVPATDISATTLITFSGWYYVQ